LAVVPIEIPPLRSRKEDIPHLVSHFLYEASRRLGEPLKEFDALACEMLAEYQWPGNVRELKNVVTRACVMTPEPLIPASRLRPWLVIEGGNLPEDRKALLEASASPPDLSLAEI